MKTYRVRVQHPYTTWYEQAVTVQADSVEAAQAEAVRQADEVIGWDDAVSAGDGECGDSVPWAIAEIVDGRLGEETYCKAEVDPVPDHLREAAPDLLAALRGVLASLEWHTQRRGNFGLDDERQYDARAAIAKATGAP